MELREQPSYFRIVVNEHAACGASHEEFHPWYAGVVGMQDFIKVGVCRPDEECIVGCRGFGCTGHFLLPCLDSGGERGGVWHIEKRRYAPCYGCTAFGCDVALLGHSRIAEMHMLVNHAGE
jgi:hypothetical protein